MIHKNYTRVHTHTHTHTHISSIHFMDTSRGNFNCPASCKNFNGENTAKRGVINKAATGLREVNLCNLFII